MVIKYAAIGAALFLCAACATNDSSGKTDANSSADHAVNAVAGVQLTQLSASEAAEVSGDGVKKQSLNKMLDEHRQVTLIDDDTGKEKLICKRLRPQTGTHLTVRKKCMSPYQWRQLKQQSEDQVEDIQRRMDARSNTGG